jgi:DNA-binding SARP family transcriptional activator
MMMRLARGLWSLGWLTVLLVGIPAALIYYIGWPLPDHWPTRLDWEQWVQQPMTRSAVIGTFAVLVWLLWALLAYALVIEILHRSRRGVRALRSVRLPPLPTPMQATASGVLGAAVFGVPTGGNGPPMAVIPAPTGAAALPAGPVAAHRSTPPGDIAQQPNQADDGGRRGRTVQPARLGGTGLTLPDGGWVTDHTAAVIMSAAALVWLQRRRRYVAGQPTGEARTDADLAPLPDTVAAVAIRRLADDEDAPPGGDTVDTAASAVHPAVVGHSAGEPVQPRDLPAGGLGLVGEGGRAVARGILATTLLSGDPWNPAADARVITTITDIEDLLDMRPDPGRPTPGLTLAPSLDAAITAVEEAAVARTQIATRGVSTASDDTPPAGSSFPPIVIVASRPTPEQARRLAFVLTLTAPLDISGVLLGSWPHGVTWEVTSDGTTRPVDRPTEAGPRLCVLTATATADLLAVLREARANRHRPPEAGPTALRTSGAGQSPPTAPDQPQANNARPARSTGSTPAPSLHVRLLGEPSIRRADGRPIQIRRNAALQILIFLAVHPEGATSNQLIAALWPGPRPQAAAGRLYTPMSELRLTLQRAAGTEVLVRVADRYRLDKRHLTVDLWQLRAAVHTAARSAERDSARAGALHEVIDAYTGDLAADQQWPWIAAPREAIRRHAIDAYATLAAEADEPRTALTLLQAARNVDPANEDLYRRVRQVEATLKAVHPDRD